MFFETMVREIGELSRLEGTVHINIGLLGEFMLNYLLAPNSEFPPIGVVASVRPTRRSCLPRAHGQPR